eukprot:14361206-Alexandrium_andersonii.AAC.1
MPLSTSLATLASAPLRSSVTLRGRAWNGLLLALCSSIFEKRTSHPRRSPLLGQPRRLTVGALAAAMIVRT